MLNFFKFVVKLMGLVLGPIAFGYAGFFLAFIANNEAATYVVIYATVGFGLMMLNQMLGQLKSMNWGVTSIIMMAFAGICVMGSMTIQDSIIRFIFNALILVTGIFGLFSSFKSYEEPEPEQNED